jgi:1,4-alpha-glucan branching enzyme
MHRLTTPVSRARRNAPTATVIALLLLALLTGGCGQDRAPLAPTPDAPSLADGDLAKVRTDTFTLQAYAVDSVHVAGSQNAWASADPTWQLTLQPDGYTWRLIRTVADGLFTYKLVVRKGAQTLWLTDPAAIEVAPDGFNSSPAYWNAVRGRVFTRPRALPEPIDRTRLVIYEIAPNDFSASGTFGGVQAGLTSVANLADLGVNAIELMPVTAPSYNGWGYDPVLQFAPNPSYGSPTTFAGLVDAAHAQGVAVILDAVINHMSGSAPLRQLDTFAGGNHFTTTEENPWGLVELNFNDPALKAHILASLCRWVDAYNIDGFRFDYVGGEPATTWDWLRGELRARYPHLLLIAEDFTPAAYGNSVTRGYDAQWGGNHTDSWGGGGNNFNQVLITALTQRGFAVRGSTTPTVGAFGPAYNNMWAVANVVSGNSGYAGAAPGDGFSDVKYLESHDENRVVWSVDTIGSTGAQAVGGLTKARLGAIVSFTSIGIPMLYNGQEIGSGEYRPNGTSTYKINWAAGDASLRQAYRRLIDLRLTRPALRTEHVFFPWRAGNLDQTEYTLTYWRGTTGIGSAAEVVVACNFDSAPHTWNVSFPSSGNWVKFDLGADNVEMEIITGAARPTTLPASTALLWLKADGSSGVPQ